MAGQKILQVNYRNDEFWFPQVAPQLKGLQLKIRLSCLARENIE